MPHLLLDVLKRVFEQLKKRDCSFAVAGGLAATFFRETPRITNDIDIALLSRTLKETRLLAEEVIEALHFKPYVGQIGNAKSKLAGPALISGKPQTKSFTSSVDFLLPSFPWLREAVLRAQDNCLDYGFALVPTLYVEDVIIAKCFALSIEATRFQDLDDIKSIFVAGQDLDIAYILKRFETLEISLPKALHPFAPKALSRTARRR